MKYNIAYFKVTIQATEKRLRFWINGLKGMPAAKILVKKKDNFDNQVQDAILRTKEKVYYNIVEYLNIKG